jgi:hypothetical protein
MTRSQVSAGSASTKKTVQWQKRQTNVVSVNVYLQRLFKTCYNIFTINFPKIHQLTWTLHTLGLWWASTTEIPPVHLGSLKLQVQSTAPTHFHNPNATWYHKPQSSQVYTPLYLDPYIFLKLSNTCNLYFSFNVKYISWCHKMEGITVLH